MIRVGVLKESVAGERRVALTPDICKHYVALGIAVSVEKGAGAAASYTDQAYADMGADLSSRESVLKQSDVVVGVYPPESIGSLKEGATLIAQLQPYQHPERLEQLAAQRIQSFALELLPRISRAQSMDILSSQSNLAGYRAVIEGLALTNKVFPMMTTAAGTVKPAQVLVLGAGVAGLQAIATAKRMGAVVFAFDVRAAVKEQVESLGAKFVEVPDLENAENKGGYAKELTDEQKARQMARIVEVLKTQDVVITTALIPGKPAPVLITKDMVRGMKSGAVIVDMAAANGGNCEYTKADQTIVEHGVTILGASNLTSAVARDASQLYTKNVFQFVSLLYNKEEKALTLNLQDEIVAATLVTHQGKIVHPQFAHHAKSSEKPVTEQPRKDVAKKAPPKAVSSDKPHLKKKAQKSNKGAS